MKNTFPRPSRCAPVLSAALALAISSSAVVAENATQTSLTDTQQLGDDGSSERIALAGQLRMLSQRVVSAACFYQAGIEPDSSLAVLGEATAAFGTIAHALEHGDPALGVVGAEDRRRTLAGLAKLNELWTPIADLAQTVKAGAGTTEDVSAIATQSVALLDVADRLVVQITSQYAGQTTVLQSDAVRLDIAGRQRTLSQQIAMNGCLVQRGIEAETNSAALATAAQNFDVSMNALRFGLQEVGILPPPNQDIIDSLDEVAGNWSFMNRIVSNLTSGGSVDDLTLGVMFLMSNQVTGNMERVVDLYSEASKLDS